MKVAPLPPNEAERLAALEACEILDTLPEQAYDDVTSIAAQICDTPIALISLVDADRQWFKSRVGLGPQETPRAIAFCSHAILEPTALMVVEDASRDERFADNPLVTGAPHIRFYAGAPLVTSDGHPLGTLCVIDRKARPLEPDERETLLALSRQVVSHLELRRTLGQLRHTSDRLAERTRQVERSRDELAELCHVLECQAEVIDQDLRRAEVIQRSLLPQDNPRLDGFSVHALYRPGRAVGGDLYDVVRLGDRYVALVVADAAGHGVSAAMLSVLFKHRLRLTDDATGTPLAPGDALARVNAALCDDVAAPGIFVTAAVGLLDTEAGTLAVASAGHPPALWLRADGRCVKLVHTGPALGLYPDAIYEDRTIDVARGDRVLFYTDGLLDVGEEGISVEKLAGELCLRGKDPEALDRILADVATGRERQDRDDVTMLLLAAAAGASEVRQVGPAPVPADVVEPEPATIRRGRTGRATVLCLEGRVTWTIAQALLDAAAAVVADGRPLVLDLSRCTHLDSTCFGTLHEIVERADVAGTEIRLQGVSARHRAALDELSMRAVLERIAPTCAPLPEDLTPLALPEVDLTRQQRRLLRAHEVLAELSEKNRAAFGDVVAALRRDADG